MVNLYNAAEVFMGCAGAEGFGIPIIEAGACGLPTIVTNCSAMPELVRWGAAVPTVRKVWIEPLRSWWAEPDIRYIAGALNGVYERWHSYGCEWPLELRKATSKAIRAEFGWNHVFETAWVPLLRGLVASRNKS